MNILPKTRHILVKFCITWVSFGF